MGLGGQAIHAVISYEGMFYHYFFCRIVIKSTLRLRPVRGFSKSQSELSFQSRT